MKMIPSYITILNIVVGCLAIVFAMEGKLNLAAYLILTGTILDFLDGFAARLLNAQSEHGKQMDSLADMVTFGIAPSIVIYQLFMLYGICPIDGFCTRKFAFLMLPIAAAWRLATFNTNEKEENYFSGIPTTFVALFIASMQLALSFNSIFSEWIKQEYVMLFTPVILAYLMVADLPMLSLKIKDFTFKNNKYRFVLIGLSILLIAFLQFTACYPILLTYIILSIVSKKLM